METVEENNKILEDQLKETFELLDQYNGNEIDYKIGENVILLIGITGSGKSTVAQFLNNNENLTAVKRNGAYLFVDGNKISDSTTISKTLIPELIPVIGTDFVVADCPGFSDTRSVSHDIAATIFTNRLLKQVKNVKIVLVISHHALMQGIDRVAFTDTLGHIVEFIKNVPKYQQSIGLIVTKVENQMRENEDEEGNITYTLIPDYEMKENIIGFLQNVKNELQMDENIARQQKKIELIDIILSKTLKNSSKIEIFRKPVKVGAVTVNKLFQMEKAAIQKLLFEEMIYTEANQTDFGISVSADSKVVTGVMTASVKEQLKKTFNQVCDSMLYEFKTITEINKTYEQQYSLREALNKFLDIHRMMKSLIEDDFQISDFVNTLNSSNFEVN
jgi:energy-coupling factor transporter ATP-binding protein EcfA2